MIIMKNYFSSFTKKRIWITIGVIGCIAYFITSYFRTKEFFGPGLADPMVTYVSDYGNFAIDHPESWKGYDTPHGNHGDQYALALIKPFRTWPSLIVAASNNTSGELDQVVDWGEERARENDGYQEESIENFNFPNIQGMVRQYTYSTYSSKSGSMLVHCTDYYSLYQGRGYILRFCADEPIWADAKVMFQEMIHSFEFR